MSRIIFPTSCSRSSQAARFRWRSFPLLTQILTLKGRDATWLLFSRVANLAFIVTAIAAIIIAIFAEQIVKSEIGIAPGFGLEQQQLIAELMRLNLIATLIFSISGLVIGGLQANQHFILPALAPSLYNIGMIFGALVLSPTEPYRIGPVTLPTLGYGMHGLVYGVILGAALHLGIQIPGLIRYEFRWTPSIDIHNAEVARSFKDYRSASADDVRDPVDVHRARQFRFTARSGGSGLVADLWLDDHAGA